MTAIPGAQSVVSSGALAERFREAMASFPSGVTIATTADSGGRWWGFTATSFCSVSMDPPLILLCLAKSARSYPVFCWAKSWVVHILGSRHAALARRFATAGADKFAAARFVSNASGDPVLDESCTVLECIAFARHDGGDHTILVGEVIGVRTSEQPPAIYFRRAFHTQPHPEP